MTHSASSVRQESINNKKAVNVISAKKVPAPSFFSPKKALAPSFFSSKKVFAPSFFSQKNNEMTSIMENIKEKKLLEPTVADQISGNFSNLSKEMIMNHFQIKDGKERLSFVDHQCKMPKKFGG